MAFLYLLLAFQSKTVSHEMPPIPSCSLFVFFNRNPVVQAPSFSMSMQETWLNTTPAFDPASFASSPVLWTKNTTKDTQRTFSLTKIQSSKREKEVQSCKSSERKQKPAPTYTVPSNSIHTAWTIPRLVTLFPQTEMYFNGAVTKQCTTARWRENDTQQTIRNKKKNLKSVSYLRQSSHISLQLELRVCRR